jgi:hypothetical protein
VTGLLARWWLVTDLDGDVARVWSSDVRPLVREAWRCYNAGAVRAAISSTWTAVTTDLIDKITRLADSGDADAKAFRAEVDAAQAKGIKPEGVRAMQTIEDKLLTSAEKFELIDSIGSRELGRIREDRNLCVHPSLRHLGEVYEPRPEVARSHLAVALSTVLMHPPTQGRKVLTEFTAYVCDPIFSPSPAHVQATFFDRVRSATRRNIVEVAAKHALCELQPPATIPIASNVLADRMAETLNAFALRDRELVRTTLAGLIPRFQPLDSGIQLRTLSRLGDQDFFWDNVDQPLADRLNDLIIAPLAVGEHDALTSGVATFLALVRDERARTRLPNLEQCFTTLAYQHQMDVAAVHPDPYFVPMVINHVATAPGWRTAERVGQLLVVPHARYLAEEDLRALLTAWCHNSECRQASGMPGLATELFAATGHFGSAGHAIWQEFLTCVRQLEPEGSGFRYDDIEAALRSAVQ